MSSLSRLTSSPRVLVFALVGTLLVLAGATWFLLVAPKRTQETNLAAQLQEAQSTLKASQHIEHHKTRVPLQAIAAARALPASLEMPAVLIDLNRVATADHVTLESLAPQAPVAYTSFEAAPFTLIADGRFFAIEKFLHDLRQQVLANSGGIRSTGRLFDVQSITFTSGTAAPLLAVTLNMAVFYYLAGVARRYGDATELMGIQVGGRSSRAAHGRDALKAKEHRQKVILAGGVVVLLVVVAVEVLPMLGGGSSGTQSPAPAATPASAPPATGAQAVATSVAPSSGLVVPRRISRLPAKDPFVSLVATPAASAPTGGTGLAASPTTEPGPAIRVRHFVAKDPFVVQVGAVANTTPALGSAPATAAPAATSAPVPAPPGTGFVVVLASIPPAHGMVRAERLVVDATRDGLANVAITQKKKTSPLVISSGPYRIQTAADQALVEALRVGYKGAYVQALHRSVQHL